MLAGTVKPTAALLFNAIAVPIAGIPGTVAGVALLEPADAVPVPTLLVAVTVKVYGVPFVSPVTVRGLLAPLAVIPPGLAVTV